MTGNLFTTDLLERTISRLQAHEPPDGYYLAFSGGKDSIVLYEVALLAGVKFDAHFNLTTVDPPEVIRFIRDHYPQVEFHRPKRTMWELIVRHKTPPTRLMRYCCRELKETGGKGRFVLTGIRADESLKRSKRSMVERCTRVKSRHFLHPIIDWSEQDVWDFIRSRELAYPCLYDEGFTRIGCILCPMQRPKLKARDAERWPKYKQAYLRAFAKMLEYRREIGMTHMDNWTDAQQVYDWWVSDKPGPKKIPENSDADIVLIYED